MTQHFDAKPTATQSSKLDTLHQALRLNPVLRLSQGAPWVPPGFLFFIVLPYLYIILHLLVAGYPRSPTFSIVSCLLSPFQQDWSVARVELEGWREALSGRPPLR